MAALTPGTLLGVYVVGDQLAANEHTELYEARTADARRVVIRRLRPDVVRTATVTAFLDAAGVAMFLSHPNVANCLEVASLGGEHIAVFENVYGKDLRRVLDHTACEGRLPINVAICMVVDAAAGLGRMRALIASMPDIDGGLVASFLRALSPSNLVCEPTGKTRVVDIGRSVRGYLAPEIRQGAAPDGRSDAFALGAILFEALSGRSPFADGDQRMLPRPAAAQGSELEYIVEKALELNPALRYRSAAEFREALSRFAERTGLDVSRSIVADYLTGLARRRLPLLADDASTQCHTRWPQGTSPICEAICDDAETPRIELVRPPRRLDPDRVVLDLGQDGSDELEERTGLA